MNWGSEMAKRKGVRTRAEAKKLMWEYYRDNKTSLPKWIGECREDVISDLENGLNTGASFSRYTAKCGVGHTELKPQVSVCKK